MVDFDRTLVPDIFATDKVLYECSCGALKPLTSTYFCRHCLKMRCRDCVSHEVCSKVFSISDVCKIVNINVLNKGLFEYKA